MTTHQTEQSTVGAYLGLLRHQLSHDENLLRFQSLYRKGTHAIAKSTPHYLLRKIPVIQWLPSYSPSWIFNDILAGLTIGILLVPQSLGYATVAGLSGQVGLISAWIPTALYTIMGTSKDVTAGPTSIMALLTGEIVSDFKSQGYSPQSIASAVAFLTGIYSLAIGLFELGFLLDYIPLPVLSGYVSAAALTIIFGQIPTMFGETGVGSTTGDIIHDFFVKLPQTKWRDFLVGITGIFMLSAMQYVGRKWGKKYRIVWFLSMSRNALALILFTSISYGVNRNLKTPLFAISKTTGSGIETPKAPDFDLVRKVAGRSVAVFIAASLEHLAIGKSFGRRHNYSIDQSQELTYIGVANFLNSFFGGMPITGGFSRTAVNSESGVKSPLSGVITTACVLVSIYKLTGAFYWIPKATLSAIIITAVWSIVLPAKVFWRYWQTSFADFIASMVSFWVTLFVSVEYGIAAAVAYSLVYLLLRIAFSRVIIVTPENFSTFYPSHSASAIPLSLPEGVQIFRMNESVLFPNARRIKNRIIHMIKSRHTGLAVEDRDESERLWNEAKHLEITPVASLPRLQVVVLDLSSVNYIDTTGVQELVDLKAELYEFAGEDLDLRFFGMNETVSRKFKRANWELRRAEELNGRTVRDGGDIVFDVIQAAISKGNGRELSPNTTNLDIEATGKSS